MSADFNNPYLAARAEWLERYGSYIKSRNQWRVVAFICLSIVMLSVGGNVYQSMQSKIIPYVVEVSRLGKVVAVQRADQAEDVPAQVIQSTIAQCVSDWRTVTADFGLQEKLINRLSGHIAGTAKGILKTWYENNSPYERGKDILIEVKPNGVPMSVSADSWRIEWTEIVRNHEGAFMGSTAYEATITISIKPPTTEAGILRNPLGVYIVNVSHSKIIN